MIKIAESEFSVKYSRNERSTYFGWMMPQKYKNYILMPEHEPARINLIPYMDK